LPEEVGSDDKTESFPVRGEAQRRCFKNRENKAENEQNSEPSV